MLVYLLAALVWVGSPATLKDDQAPVDYTGYKTVRVSLGDESEKGAMKELAEEELVMILDEGVGSEVDVLVSPENYATVAETFRNHEVLSENVEEEIDHERQDLLRVVPGVFDFKNYYAVKYQHVHLDTLAKRHPDKTEIFSIGSSYEGRDMKCIKISNDLANSDKKPMIWIDGGIHAREWISSHTVMYFADALLGEVEPSLQTQLNSLLDKYQFVILPMSNPDGYEFSRTHNRFWRKTRRPSGCKYNYERNGRCIYGTCYGIDPNRNWDADFGRNGVSSNPCSDVYPGKQPFTENNTKAMRDYLLKHLNNLAVYLSFHSYSQLFLKPYGYKTSPPSDRAHHDSVGAAYVAAVEQTHGKQYRNIRAAELYPASGTSEDYMYDQGILNSYTLELRDTGRYGFRLPASQIIPTAEENIRGFLAMMKKL